MSVILLGTLALGGCYTSGQTSLYTENLVQPVADGAYVSGENVRQLKRLPDGRYAMVMNANKKANEVRLARLEGVPATFIGQVGTDDGNIYVAIRQEKKGFAVLRPTCDELPDRHAAAGLSSYEDTFKVCQFSSAAGLETAMKAVIEASPASRWEHYVKR